MSVLGSPRNTKFVVIDAGGAGGIIERLRDSEGRGIVTVTIHDQSPSTKSNERVLTGRGEIKAAEFARKVLKNLSSGDVVFICIGLDGVSMEDSVAPIIAKTAKEQGAVVVAIIKMPFTSEIPRLVQEWIGKIKECADTVVVSDIGRLRDCMPDLPVEHALDMMDWAVAEIIKDVSSVSSSLTGFRDVVDIVGHGGTAIVFIGEDKRQNKVRKIEKCLKHLLLDSDCGKATGAFVCILCGHGLAIDEIEDIVERIAQGLGLKTKMVWSARINEKFKDTIRVAAIITGVTPKI